MNFATHYLGLNLKNPLIPGASPMTGTIDSCRRLEDANAAAVVLPSLFEEQITGQRFADIYHMEMFGDGFAESMSQYPASHEYRMSKEQYLELIRSLKEKLSIPVIASLNGATPGGWMDYGRLVELAGADALELNLYFIAGDARDSAAAVESRLVEIVRGVTTTVTIPVTVKLLPFFSSMSHFAWQLESAGAAGLVLFNRFYQPDIDINVVGVTPAIRVSCSDDLLIRLRWLSILSRQLSCGLAASGGVRKGDDLIKCLLAGANAVQLVTGLMKGGPDFIDLILGELARWMEGHRYASVEQMRGAAANAHIADAGMFERGNYIRSLQTWDA